MDNSNEVLVQINTTKLAFNELLSVNNNICSLLDTVNDTRSSLKQEYVDIVKKYNKADYLFGLDTFNFQTRLIDNDYQHLRKYYNLITNRIYLDYFKLIKMVAVTFKDTTRNNQIENLKYKYDYLNIYKPYDIDTIKNIFMHIISIIEESHHYLTEECKSHSTYELKLGDGFDINNFVTYYDFKNKSNLQNINLYINYLNFFISLHDKYLNKVYFRLNLMYQQLNHEVKIDKFNTKKHSKDDIMRDINELHDTQLSKYAYNSTHSINLSAVNSNKDDSSILNHLVNNENSEASPKTKSLEDEIINHSIKSIQINDNHEQAESVQTEEELDKHLSPRENSLTSEMKIETNNDNIYISNLVESMVNQVSNAEETENINLLIDNSDDKKKTRI